MNWYSNDRPAWGLEFRHQYQGYGLFVLLMKHNLIDHFFTGPVKSVLISLVMSAQQRMRTLRLTRIPLGSLRVLGVFQRRIIMKALRTRMSILGARVIVV
jgi:hypothetical protein